MSESLFGRVARVTVGPPGAEGYSWSALRIGFEVSSSSSREPNKGSVELYNLNAESRAWVQREGQRLVIEAGYVGSSDRIFVGDIDRVVVRRDGADVITEIEAGDGEEFFRQHRTSLRLPPGGTLGQVVRAIVASATATGVLDAATLRLSDELEGVSLQGLTVHGDTRDVLDRIARSVGAEWSVQDGVLELVSEGQAIEASGVIARELYTVERMKADQTSGRGAKAGYRIALPLDGSIRPRRLVQIVGVDGWRRAAKVKHAGDTHDASRWQTECELEDL